MSADLCATPTRLALLQDIAGGRVFLDRHEATENYRGTDGRKYTSAVQQLIAAGWVVKHTEGRYADIRLTEEGRRVLKEGDQR